MSMEITMSFIRAAGLFGPKIGGSNSITQTLWTSE